MISPLTGLIGTLLMLFVMLFLRIPVGFAMALMGFLGMAYVVNWNAALGLIGTDLWNTFSSYGLTVIPMFIFMGQICFYSEVNQRLYNAAYKWFGRIRGGLGITTVMACAGFAAICGSNTATAATMTSVALPEMKKYKYDPILSSGSRAAGSTLGVVIPPSVVLVVYGIYTGESIGKLFVGSFVPGLILAAIMAAIVYLMCIVHPSWGPKGPKFTLMERIKSLPDAIDMVLMFGIIMYSLYAGYFTPSEAGAAGSVVAIIIASSKKAYLERVRQCDHRHRPHILHDLPSRRRCRDLRTFPRCDQASLRSGGMVSNLPVASWMILWAMLVIYIIGGCVMDALAFLLITVPIFYPVAQRLGYDPIWFGVIITVVTTMGAVTPPVGISAYVVSGMAKDIQLSTVFRGVIWFLPAFVIAMILLQIFPELVTYFAGWIRF